MKWIIGLFLLSVSLVKASEIGETFGYSIPIEDEIQDGQILCKENNKFELCKVEYSINLAGVYNEKPAIYLDDNLVESKPLISAGKAWVLVLGPIKKGDYVTSSETLGVAMRADRSGVVLGIAMENYENKEMAGKIQVLIGIKTIIGESGKGGNLLDTLKQGFVVPSLDALSSLRYWLAILICIVSFTIGFIYYGKISKTGIEAMGRNPLAGKMIQMNIILNMVLITLIMVAGLALAYAIVVV